MRNRNLTSSREKGERGLTDIRGCGILWGFVKYGFTREAVGTPPACRGRVPRFFDSDKSFRPGVTARGVT